VHAQALKAEAGQYELQVLIDGQPAPRFNHGDEHYVLGRHGARYTLRVLNRSDRRIEAVVTVDGLDVVDGKRGDLGKRGYLVPAWGSIDIDGWRLSEHQAAAFRFSTVADSYAARSGAARNVGVIGAAIFPERYIAPPRPIARPRPVPYDLRAGRGSGMDRNAAAMDESAADAPMMNSVPADGAVQRRQSERSTSAAAPAKRRPGLGTEFGEAMHSQVHEVEFVRDRPHAPAQLLGVRYDDRAGLVAMGVELEPRCDSGCRERALRRSASPFPVSYRPYATPPHGFRGE
jgi:hypothetical protein